ncbi:DUF4886 domain-containing protein [Rariglobus hedericola]|uniref:PEP-CTERM sorting domain-containing protein n=1 Tax=Rariglobus hedericola TaxID=2597822 RepID=A0A556QRS5_9BACT|nr:DUF4886 domain-containing protein [Rariglobus hedericola]TSJ79338.1 PEP-CTERM sorting domain-containing protein [Rariglobus hedericola]
MHPLRPVRLLAISAFLFTACLQAQNILFVGNSFTFVPSPLDIGTVTDLNAGKPGGVPAIFEVLAVAGGKTPTVSMETVGGKTLQFHYETKRELIDKAWDIVILQDYSTGPIPEANGGTKSFDSFRAHVPKLKELFTAQNPKVKIWLYETWARPDVVMKGRFATIEDMQAGLRSAYSAAAKDNALQGWVPVGDTFLAAVKQGLADNPATPDSEGPLKIWGKDNYHQSAIGAYISALLFYGRIYDADPRDLPSDNAAAVRIKLSTEDSKKLQALAWEQLQLVKQP